MIYNKEYDYIIPIGSNCRLTFALIECALRKHSMPFDWMLSTMKSINKIFENDFHDFFNYNTCSKKSFEVSNGTNFSYVLNDKYNLNITHEKNVNDENILKYKRRIDRMFNILNNKDNKILFIRNSMDDVIFDELHNFYLKTEPDYCDFNKEHIQEFNNIIKNKFDFYYDILVITHNKSIEFSEENIYNLKSNSSYFDTLKVGDDKYMEWDQKACKSIIEKLGIKLKSNR